jgi:O-antigen/teichoic acid export membrane protein
MLSIADLFKAMEATRRKAGRAIGEMRADAALRKRAGNVGHLLAGNFGAGAISFGAVILAARALGPEQYGVLALAAAFVQAIERFVSFQTWQPIIRYGAGLIEAEKKNDFKALVKFGFLLDLSTAAAGWAIACSLALFGARIFGWDNEAVSAALLYSLVLLIAINGAPTGVLRLAGRFREIAYVQVVSNAVRVALCVAALFSGSGLLVFVAIWTVTHMLSALLLIAATIRELRRLDALDFMGEPLGRISERFPKIWRFSIVANVSLTVRSSTQQFDTLLVGALVGPAGAGLYHIAKRVAKFAHQAGMQIQAVVFPDIAKHWAAGDVAAFKQVVRQTEMLLAGLCLAGFLMIQFVAAPVIHIFVGEAFAPAAAMLRIQIVAVVLLLCGSVARTALLSMGKETTILAISIVSTLVFFVSAFLLLPTMGAMGANVAHAVEGLIMITGLWIAFRAAFRRASLERSERAPIQTH